MTLISPNVSFAWAILCPSFIDWSNSVGASLSSFIFVRSKVCILSPDYRLSSRAPALKVLFNGLLKSEGGLNIFGVSFSSKGSLTLSGLSFYAALVCSSFDGSSVDER